MGAPAGPRGGVGARDVSASVRFDCQRVHARGGEAGLRLGHNALCGFSRAYRGFRPGRGGKRSALDLSAVPRSFRIFWISDDIGSADTREIDALREYF